jgi:hypothetical protein
MKKSSSTSNDEYDCFKALLGKVLAVPHEDIVRREEAYQKASKANPLRRGPKRKPKPASPASADQS